MRHSILSHYLYGHRGEKSNHQGELDGHRGKKSNHRNELR